MDKISYALGLGIGQQIKSMNIENFSIEDFAKSISDVMEDKETAFTSREAQVMLQEFFQKKQKEEQKMRNSLRVGDEITTIGGIIGKVVSIKEETCLIETSGDRTKIRLLKSAIKVVDVKAEDC